jgi:hypothetical protein
MPLVGKIVIGVIVDCHRLGLVVIEFYGCHAVLWNVESVRLSCLEEDR